MTLKVGFFGQFLTPMVASLEPRMADFMVTLRLMTHEQP